MLVFIYGWESPCHVVANVLDCSVIVREFKLQLHYYVHFWTNTLGKGKKSIIPHPNYGLNSTSTMVLALNKEIKPNQNHLKSLRGQKTFFENY